MSALRAGLPEAPPRIAALPVVRGYPVPWFVAWVDDDGEPVEEGFGTPDFRLLRRGAIAEAHRFHRCWICGGRLASRVAFVVGPMCAVNRVSAEPPSHAECAEWAARACPFLTRPHARRRDQGIPEDALPAAGFMVERNPGVALVWVTRRYTVASADAPAAVRAKVDALSGVKASPGGVIFRMGDPERVAWYAEGRCATRAEVDESIRTGLPALEQLAALQGGRAPRMLAAEVARVEALLP